MNLHFSLTNSIVPSMHAQPNTNDIALDKIFGKKARDLLNEVKMNGQNFNRSTSGCLLVFIMELKLSDILCMEISSTD